MRRYVFCSVILFAVNVMLSRSVKAVEIVPPNSFKLESLRFVMPDGWQLVQNIKDDGRLALVFGKGSDVVNVYVNADTTFDMHKVFGNGATIQGERNANYGRYSWSLIETKRERSGAGVVFVTGLKTEYKGRVYFGYSRAASASTARSNAEAVLGTVN